MTEIIDGKVMFVSHSSSLELHMEISSSRKV